MLGQRVVTALLLLAVLAAVLLSGSRWAFLITVIVVCAFAVREWLALTITPRGWKLLLIGLLIFNVAFLLTREFDTKQQLLKIDEVAFGSALWILIAFTFLRSSVVLRNTPWLACLYGLVLIKGFGYGLIALHARSLTLLLLVISIPIIADTAAYFVGRRFGKRKLAPQVSPGKTVEGAIGGLAAVTLTHGAWVIHAGWHWWWILIFVFLAMMSIVGDLFESLLKRQAGVKDSSNLLPGHGGMLDRIDAQLPVVPLAALAFSTLPLM